MYLALNFGKAMQEADDWSDFVASHAGVETAQAAVQTTILPLIRQVNRLSLATEAMWSLIQERTDLTDKDLCQRITDLDLEDGVRDDRHKQPPADCPECGAKICREFNRCLFCGYRDPEGSAFNAT
jgi:hypothetical protein